MQISLTDEQAGIIQAGKNVGTNLNGEIQRARVVALFTKKGKTQEKDSMSSSFFLYKEKPRDSRVVR